MNSSNPVLDFDFLNVSELLLYRGGHSALHLGVVHDQVGHKAEVGLCSVSMSDFCGKFASRAVQQNCDFHLEQLASLAMLLTRLGPSGFEC